MFKKPTYEDLEQRIRDLEASQSFLESLMDMLPECVSYIDNNHRFKLANKKYQDFFNAEPSSMIGLHPRDVFGDAAYEKVRRQQKAALSGQEQAFESSFLLPHGDELYFHAHYLPHIEDGQVKGFAAVVQDITRLKEAYDTIEKSNTLLASTERVSKVGGWEWDAVAETMSWTDETYRIHGYDPNAISPGSKEHIEKSIERYDVEDRSAILSAFQDCLDKGKAYDLDFPLTKTTGERIWVRTMARPVYENGRVVKVIGNIMDITDRKQAEEVQKKLAHDHSAILDNIPAYIYFKDTENNIIRISESVAEITGLPKHEIEGHHSSEIYPEMADQYWADDLEVIRTGKPKTGIVEPLPIAGGKQRWLHTDKVPVFDDTGTVSGVVVIASDISEIIEAKNKLSASESKFRALFEHAADGVYLVSEDGTFVDVNKATEIQTGYRREQLIGMSVGDLDPRSIEKNDEKMIWRKLKPGDTYVLDTTHIRKDGSSYPAEIHISLVELADQRLILGSVRDITERRKIEKRLRQSQKMESIGNLAGGIAHDFNNIIASIIGFTELAMDEVEKKTTMGDNLQEIYSASLRARDLVKQILAFARQSDEALTPIQPGLIAKELLQFMRSTIPTTIEIQHRIYSDSLIMGNATQVHQVLMNLCTNAAQAMEKDGGILDIIVSDVAAENITGIDQSDFPNRDYVEIRVSDTGAGMAEDTIRHIFEPYFTTKGPGEGTGMGLAVVHGVVKAFSGQIVVDSKEGHGTTFAIYLPITRKRANGRAYRHDELPTGEERILFVDDEAPIAKMGGQILSRLGYTVTTRTSSVDAVELFRSQPHDFDLVITDMTMPRMSGDRLAIELLAIRHDVPIILCTGYSNRISEAAAADIGIRAFAYKPIVKAELAKTVREVLDGKKVEG